MFPSYIYDVLQNREIEVIVNTEKINPRLTTTVVKSYVPQHKMRADQLSDLITSVHQALGQLGQPVTPEEVLTPAAYSERRSTMAKGFGFGRKSTAQATPEVSPPAAPTPVVVD